jgi:limonene-1,2-epoxide hydrolase
MNVEQIVLDFMAAWNRRDLDAAFDMMADDIVWHNIPMEPAVGVDACKTLMASFPPSEGINFDTHHISSKGNVVMTERTDGFLIGGRWRNIRLMGIFEVNPDGTIAQWRDYFDMLEFQREFA